MSEGDGSGCTTEGGRPVVRGFRLQLRQQTDCQGGVSFLVGQSCRASSVVYLGDLSHAQTFAVIVGLTLIKRLVTVLHLRSQRLCLHFCEETPAFQAATEKDTGGDR